MLIFFQIRLFFQIFIGVQLIYNVLLASGVQQTESVTHIYKSVGAQWRLTLCDPMDWGLPGSSVHGILQARILEQFAISSSRGSSQPRYQNYIFPESPALAGGFFTICPTWDNTRYIYIDIYIYIYLYIYIYQVQFSCSVMSDCLRPH